MNLIIKFPNNLITEDMLEQYDIPCFCKVAKEFTVTFTETIPQTTGIITGWEREKLSERVPSRGGGENTHNTIGLITLKKVKEDDYKIVKLSMFISTHGWCPFIENEKYAKSILLD